MQDVPRMNLLSQGGISFILVVLAAYISMLTSSNASLSGILLPIILVGGLLYIFIGLAGIAYCLDQSSHFKSVIYIVIQMALSMTLIYLSRGAAFLIIVPMASHIVMLMTRRWIFAFYALIQLLTIVIFWLLSDRWEIVLQNFFSMLACIVFVGIFTQALLNEQGTRLELDTANQKLREYALQAEELATISERNRLAREIHDSLGHYLTVINIQIEAARAVISTDPEHALNVLNKAQSLTRDGLGEIRRSVAVLRESSMESRPLPETINTLVEECRATGLVTNFHVNGEPRKLSPQAELTLYRTAQEGMTNVRKHASASRIDLTLDYSDPAHVRLTVQDNGIGRSKSGSGFGLLGIKERVQLLEGEMQTRTAPGEGFTLVVMLPTSTLTSSTLTSSSKEFGGQQA